MLGVRPIKLNIQNALCEQAPSSILYIQFCMSELLLQVTKNILDVLHSYYKKAILIVLEVDHILFLTEQIIWRKAWQTIF